MFRVGAHKVLSFTCSVALACALMPAPGLAWAVESHQGAQAAVRQMVEETSAAVASGAAVDGELVVVLADGADVEEASKALGDDAAALAAESTADDVTAARSAEGVVASGDDASTDSDVQVERVSEDAVLVAVEGVDTAALAERLAQDDAVAYVQPNYVYTVPENAGETEASTAEPAAVASAPASMRTTVVNDPLWSDQEYLAATGFAEAWDTTRVNGTVSVAVLDSAINLEHEDLVDSLDVEHGWDAVSQGPLESTASVDHGTEVTGVIAASCDNGHGMAGASYGANVVPVTVLSGTRLSTTTSVLVRAMEYVLELDDAHPELNMRVVNMSFGGYGAGDASVMDRAFRAKVRTAVEDHDMVVVAAGGNEHSTAISWPADWEEVVSVTSTDASLLQPASFSDHNEHKDVAAPGEDIVAPKAASASAYGTCRGTSFSTPIVSAVFALMFAAHPGLSAERAVELLCQTADDRGEAGRDDYFGWGLVNAESAVHAVESELAGQPSLRYPDVDQNAWYQTPVAYIDAVVSAGLLQGYGGLFRPDDDITRAEVFAIVYRAAGIEEGDGAPAENTTDFADNESGQWYTAAINWAAEVGIASGSEGLVRPNDRVTREEAAAIVARYASYTTGSSIEGDVASLQSASDWQTVSAWAVPSLAWASECGILTGRAQSDGSLLLAPQACATRAEFSKIIISALSVTG